jgi:hypothetical protein
MELHYVFALHSEYMLGLHTSILTFISIRLIQNAHLKRLLLLEVLILQQKERKKNIKCITYGEEEFCNHRPWILTPCGYSNPLFCDMTPESRNSGTAVNVHC